MLPDVDPPAFRPPYPYQAAAFAPGDAVRVKTGAAPGHIRTPWYLRGKTGVIERDLGETLNAEALAYNRRDDRKRLVRVRFTMAELWGESAENPADTVDIEIFEHWLEAPDAP